MRCVYIDIGGRLVERRKDLERWYEIDCRY